MARLTVVDGPDLGNEYEVDLASSAAGTQSFVIGRDASASVTLNDTAVSREHFRIERSLRGFRLLDLGSRNKTFVNGDPVEVIMLHDSDVVRVGDTELRFEEDGSEVEHSDAASTIIKEVDVEHPDRDVFMQKVKAASGEQDRRKTLESLLSRLQGILDLSGRITETRSIPELLEKFLAEVLPALEASHGAFLVRENRRWIARSSSGEDSTGEGTLKASLSIVEKATKEKKAILSENTVEDDRFRKGDSIVQEDIRSALAVPVFSRGKVSGVIYVDRRGSSRPFSDSELALLQSAAEPLGGLLRRLEEQDRLVDENRNLLRSLTENKRIIGTSKEMRDVLDFIQRAAPTNMTVLIQGETGTGKELVASAVHYNSPRRGRPFVAINCAALPENLVESELFGHERGAFTGAVSRKKGRFELADTGTVFLDEVGELSLTCQAKLLRLLEERYFERVGGTESVRVDVRILAASNKDLLEAVSRSEFREDLYYRLNVLNVRLPPLRKRPDDIPLLVQHFFEGCAASGHPKKLSKVAEKKLHQYTWPGNIRQLRNVIESACVLAKGEAIQPEDLVLPEKLRSSGGEAWEPISLQQLERGHVLKVLEHTGGNKKRAAEILGIERCTLYSKLKNYDT